VKPIVPLEQALGIPSAGDTLLAGLLRCDGAGGGWNPLADVLPPRGVGARSRLSAPESAGSPGR